MRFFKNNGVLSNVFDTTSHKIYFDYKAYSPGHSKLDPALEYIVFFIVDSVRGHIAVKYSE